MLRQVCLLLCALLALQVSADIADECQSQLDDLRNIVQGQILKAHDDLSTSLTTFQQENDDVQKTAVIDIETSHQTVLSHIVTLENLAQQAGKDPTSCVEIRQEVIDRLPSEYADGLTTCVGVNNNQAAQIVRDSTYTIDVVMNKVQSLQFALTQCGTEINCLTTILTQIQLGNVQYVQQIETQVQEVAKELSTLRLSVTACANSAVSSYTSYANSIVRDIQACIERLIDS